MKIEVAVSLLHCVLVGKAIEELEGADACLNGIGRHDLGRNRVVVARSVCARAERAK